MANFSYGPAISYPVILAFFFSLLQANWTYTGYDASAHVAEETVGARVASAWGIFLSVAVSAIVGYIFLVALTTHLPSMSALFPAELEDSATYSQYYFGGGVAVIDILVYNLGATVGGILAAGIAIAMAFCGLSSVASAGRMLFAFSRDDGLPGSGWLKKVSHRFRTPANSLAVIVVVSWLFTIAAFAVGASGGPGGGGIAIIIVTAISTIFLYAAYGVVIFLGATTAEWIAARLEPWSLVQAHRLDRDLLGRRPHGPVLVADLGQHLVPVHGGGGDPAAHLLLRLGATALQGTEGPGWRRRAHRDGAGVPGAAQGLETA